MEVRILPMSFEDEEFKGKDIDYVQKVFFHKTLVDNKGYYEYQTTGIEAKSGDLVLFQMDNQVIASAIYLDILRYKVVSIDGCRGSYKFDIKTIKTFKPITKEELSEIIPEFESFNQVKQQFKTVDLDYERLIERMN
jgi:hypothetical protein